MRPPVARIARRDDLETCSNFVRGRRDAAAVVERVSSILKAAYHMECFLSHMQAGNYNRSLSRPNVSFVDSWFRAEAVVVEFLRSAGGRISWARFGRSYRQELFLDGPIDRKSRTIKNHGQKFTLRLIKELARRGNVTLMCHCAEEEKQCHRHLLRALIASKSR